MAEILQTPVRYPVRFELRRLEPLGDPPYLRVEDARERYAAARGLTVADGADPLEWYVSISPGNRRYTVTFSSPSKTPLRVVTWEREGESLMCRRILDLVYPNGDPGGRLPCVNIVTVNQQVYTDGTIDVTLTMPDDHDEIHETTSAAAHGLRIAVPPFGEWEPLLTRPTTAPSRRFGAGALAAAITDMESLVPYHLPHDEREMVTAGSRGMSVLDDLSVASDDRPWARWEAPVIDRGAHAIVPLASVRADRRGAVERLRVVKDRLQRDAIHYYGGDSFHAETVLGEDDGYGRNLARSGIEVIGSVYAWRAGRFAAVLVHGLDHGTETLALHVLPSGWVWDPVGSAPTKRALSHQRRMAADRDAADASWTWG